ncbi:hypothetical protein ZWY2020_003938 [Hordeum vulgare]|nr:hypothetical protein ZWY2020_003938 [Hordeum vulgare]
MLVQLSAAEDKCTTFDKFLLDPRYTFIVFLIDQDIQKLELIGLEITHFVDIQKECRVPDGTNYLDLLGDVSSMLIDDYYMTMKHKLINEDHKG